MREEGNKQAKIFKPQKPQSGVPDGPSGVQPVVFTSINLLEGDISQPAAVTQMTSNIRRDIPRLG